MLLLKKDSIDMYPTIKYIFVGFSGYLMYILLLTLQVEFFYIEPVSASLIAFVPVFFLSYVLSYAWVFRSNNRHFGTFVRYGITAAIGLLLNLLIMYFTIYHLEWWYIHSQIAVFFVVGLNNYLINRYWTF